MFRLILTGTHYAQPTTNLPVKTEITLQLSHLDYKTFMEINSHRSGTSEALHEPSETRRPGVNVRRDISELVQIIS